MPTYKEHVEFVVKKPYDGWYIVEGKPKRGMPVKMGHIYITKRSEIGIHILDAHKGKGVGTQALNEIMNLHKRKRYYANINPNNLDSRMFFKKNGFNLLQNTYKR